MDGGAGSPDGGGTDGEVDAGGSAGSVDDGDGVTVSVEAGLVLAGSSWANAPVVAPPNASSAAVVTAAILSRPLLAGLSDIGSPGLKAGWTC
ncbi:hypothetical protein GCM10017774_56550 [Lentzea cavernae]|uniref:Uncharacterized protein n=1 Tax=Lentzea cavernae TaxID=2020703 RepID=A0ABQ3MMP7_9PSEU|nr:hypothetical protein GCM10017774_56550 [Lentzea cavernae]